MKHPRAFLLAVAICWSSGLAAASPQTPPPAAHPAPETLRMVVVLARHGVRSPTDPDELTRYAARPWPNWSVPPGNLTAHGAALIALEGEAYRQRYAAAGLLPATGCPGRDAIYVRADAEQRTEATADAFLAGFAPGCDIAKDVAAVKPDPLFHALPALGKADPVASRASVAGAVGNDPAAVVAANAAAFAKLEAILGCAGAPCTPVTSAPAAFLTNPKTGLTSLTGPIDIASTAVETFILEFAEGMPASDVGWGQVDRATLLWLSQLHMLKYAVNTQTYVAARAQGSNLLATLAATLAQGASGKKNPHTPAPVQARFAAFVGHDTNLEALAGLLHVTWLLPGYQPNDTPPGGALVFELFTNVAGAPVVRTFYRAQSLDQIRAGTSLATATPSQAPVYVPGCPDLDCPLATFESIVAGAIDPSFAG